MPDDRSLSRRVFVMGSLGSALAAGCGAGTTPTGAPTSTSRGAATFTILWPEPKPASRLIPVAAKSITVKMVGPETVQKTVARPPAGTTQTDVTFDSIEVGSYTVTATAYPNADGTGTAQATGSVAITVLKGQTVNTGLTMDTTIVSLIPSFNLSNLNHKSTQKLTISALDKNNNIVITKIDTLNISSNNSTIVEITKNSSDFTLFAAQEGSCNITISDSESGITQTVTTTVIKSYWPHSFGSASFSNRGMIGDLKPRMTDVKLFLSFEAPPIIGGDNALIGIYSDQLVMRNSDGSLRWSVAHGTIINGKPVITDKGNICITHHDKVTLYNYSGEKLWDHTCPNAAIYLSYQNGRIYVTYLGSGGSSGIVILDENKNLLWQQEISLNCPISIDKYNNIYFIGGADKRIVSYDSNFNLRWSSEQDYFKTIGLPVGIFGPIISPNSNIFASNDIWTYCIDQTGKNKWNVYTSVDKGFSGLTIDDSDNIYFYTDNKFLSYDSNGTKRWEFQDNSPTFGAVSSCFPLLTKTNRIITAMDGHLYCFSTDGNLIWKLDKNITSAIQIYGMSSSNTKIYARCRNDFIVFE